MVLINLEDGIVLRHGEAFSAICYLTRIIRSLLSTDLPYVIRGCCRCATTTTYYPPSAGRGALSLWAICILVTVYI